MFVSFTPPISYEPPCPECGFSLPQVARTGRVGCAHCYVHFAKPLAPYIRRIHGTAVHTGFLPDSAEPELHRRHRAAELKARLAEAVAAQEYERCAVLRDEIRALEGLS